MTLNRIQEEPAQLKRHEAAELLRVSVRTVDRLIAEGDLPASKIGRSVRIRQSDVDALLTPSSDPLRASEAALAEERAS